jgi:hypothetical protein
VGGLLSAHSSVRVFLFCFKILHGVVLLLNEALSREEIETQGNPFAFEVILRQVQGEGLRFPLCVLYDSICILQFKWIIHLNSNLLLSWCTNVCFFYYSVFLQILRLYAHGLLFLIVFNCDARVFDPNIKIFLCVAYSQYPNIFWITIFFIKKTNIRSLKENEF